MITRKFQISAPLHVESIFLYIHIRIVIVLTHSNHDIDYFYHQINQPDYSYYLTGCPTISYSVHLEKLLRYF